jgi:hypothetical protein
LESLHEFGSASGGGIAASFTPAVTSLAAFGIVVVGIVVVGIVVAIAAIWTAAALRTAACSATTATRWLSGSSVRQSQYSEK